MKAYNYHPVTKEFTSEIEVKESPMEKGAYLVPADATTQKPPAAGANERAVMIGGAWVIEKDYRGWVGYDEQGEPAKIDMLGADIPAGWSAVEPAKTPAQLEAIASDEAKGALLVLDMESIRDIRAYIASKPDATQTLRDREAAAAIERGKVK